MINAKFLSCLAQFTALRAAYKVINRSTFLEDVELDYILEDAVQSPFRDLLDAGQALGPAALDALKDMANFDNLKNPLDAIIRLFLLPLENIVNILGASTPRELKEKLKHHLFICILFNLHL